MKDATFSPRFFRLAAAVLGCALTLAAPLSGRAQDTAMPTILHGFDVTEGDTPGQLALGSDGNFYGTTAFGGFGYTTFQNYAGDGTVYRITPAGEYTTLYAFTGGPQGQNPYALIQGIDGNFYGLTGYGGVVGDSTVFRLTPAGELTTVYTFPADGASVPGPLVQDGSGNFYGVKSAAITSGGYDCSIFRFSPTGEYTTLYTFTGGGDGGTSSGLIKGSDGNFYGTSDRGTDGAGTIYRITPAGVFTVLHAFTADDYIYLSNGLTPGSDGNLYGTIPSGGVNSKGVVFRLTLAGDYTILYAFTGGSDGEYPGGRLVEGSDGNFYGLTGGTTEPTYEPARRAADIDRSGMAIPALTPVPATVFRITPQGVLTSLYASTSAFSGFILGSDGNFYGTAVDDEGLVFKLSNVSHPAFFTNQAPLTNGTYYLSFSNGNYFGYYTFQSDPNYLYHLDLGPEYFIDAKDGQEGLYLYDFRSNGFFYTSPTFPFPYLYDFNLQSVVYLFPDPNNAGRYLNTADAERYFYDFGTGTVVVK